MADMHFLPWISRCTYLCAILSFAPLTTSVSYGQDTLSTTFFFDTDRDDVLITHKEEVAMLIGLIDSSYDISSVVLLGYADRRGQTAYNQDLSSRRVRSISEYILLHHGSSIPKLRQRAYGSTLSGPDLDNDRRVDLIIYTQPKEILSYNSAIEVEDLTLMDTSLLKVGNQLKIKNLNFQPGRSKLLRSSIPQLKKLEKLMMRHSGLCIRIEGHVCCSNQLKDGNDGRDIDNNSDNLSEARAQNIYNYLVKKGIDQRRLSYIGYGHSRPYVNPELKEADRVMNRRVEILITKT